MLKFHQVLLRYTRNVTTSLDEDARAELETNLSLVLDTLHTEQMAANRELDAERHRRAIARRIAQATRNVMRNDDDDNGSGGSDDEDEQDEQGGDGDDDDQDAEGEEEQEPAADEDEEEQEEERDDDQMEDDEEVEFSR